MAAGGESAIATMPMSEPTVRIAANGTTQVFTRMTIDQAGAVGIGTTVPQSPLEVSRAGTDAFLLSSTYAYGNSDATPGYGTRFANGTPAAPTAVQSGNIIGAWIASGYGATQFSDVNGGMGVIAQENWTDTAQGAAPFGSVLGRLTALQPVHYHWRATEFPEQHFGDALASGLIAQDVEPVLPELVVTREDGYKAIDYGKLPLLTIQAVKELKTENDRLAERVAELERMVAELAAATNRH